MQNNCITLNAEAYDRMNWELGTLRQRVAHLEEEICLQVDAKKKFASMETSLRQQEEKMRLFVECTPAAIAMLDRQMRYMLVSRRWKEDYELGERNIIGRSHYEIFPEMPARWKQIHQRCLAGAVERCEEDQFVRQDGTTNWLKWEVRPWYDSTGEIGGIIMFTEVITRRKQAELALQQLNQELEKWVEERTAQLRRVVAQLEKEIRERKQAEIALQTSQQNLRTIFDNCHDAIFIHAVDGSILDVNDRMLEMYQVSREQATKLSIIDDYSSPDNPIAQVPVLWERVIAGETIRLEWQAKRPNDGSLFDVEVTLRKLQLNQEEIVLANVRDLSDRKFTQAALREKEAQYRGIFEAVTDGIFINDLETGKIIEINPAAHRMHGYSYEEFISLSPPQFVHPDSLPMFAQYLETIRAGGQFTAEAIDICKDGSPIYIEVIGTPWICNNKLHGLGVVRNITERKRVEAALRQKQAQLRQKAQELECALQELQRTQTQMLQSEKMSSLGQIVAGVAHEINNPVNFIHGNLTYASEYAEDLLILIELYQQYYPNPPIEIAEKIKTIELDFLKEDLTKLFKSMRVGTDRIREIVLSLRNFSRLDEADVKEANIHAGIDSTLMILQNRLKNKPDHPAIQVSKNYGKLPQFECYPGQLNQVFMNILVNAIDALDERDRSRSHQEIKQNPSWIQITTEVLQQDAIQIRIKDNGPGMSEEVKHRIFDPFFTTKAVGKGTGLGMSISYQIVTQKHKGSLECISSPGKGAEFIIKIPIRQKN